MMSNTRIANPLPTTSQPVSASLYQLPERQMASTASASAISKRENCILQDTPPLPSPEGLFREASQGRKQATLVGARLESLIYRHPEAKSALATATMNFLSGTDLTTASGTVAAAGQAIIRRLNDALDGHSRRVTAVLLTPEDISALRTFRHEVRRLVSAPRSPREQDPGTTSNTMQRKDLCT